MRLSWLALFVLAGCKNQDSSDAPTREEVDALIARVDALEADNATLRTEVAAKADAGDLAGVATSAEVASLEAEVATLTDEVASLGDDLAAQQETVASLDQDVGGLSVDAIERVRSDMTIEVTPGATSIQEALASLEDKSIEAGATVTLHLAAGTYTFSNTLAIQHRNGGRLRIIGDTSDPSAVVLHYTGGGRAIRVRNNGVLGALDGVTVRGDDQAGTSGIEASDGGIIYCGSAVVVEHFGGAGFRATRGGQIQAPGATARFNGGPGFEAVQQGLLAVWGASAHDNGQEGFRAFGGSVLVADQSNVAASATDNGGPGFSAQATSFVGAWGGTASGNDAGFVADDNSFAGVGPAVATDNTRVGFRATAGSAIYVGGSQSTGNEVGYAAGPTSTLNAYGGAVAEGNVDGFQSFGNGYMGLDGPFPVTATDNEVFGYNVFWGGWMHLGTNATESGATYAYNSGPYGWSAYFSDGADWGVIWRE